VPDRQCAVPEGDMAHIGGNKFLTWHLPHGCHDAIVQPMLADQVTGKGNPIFDIDYHLATLLIEIHVRGRLKSS
jgi:hypothetical protein